MTPTSAAVSEGPGVDGSGVDDSGADGSIESAPTTMRIPLPPELTARGGCPFDPPPALAQLGEQAPVSPVVMLNGVGIWVVTSYELGRTVFSDPRFSSDRFRHRSAFDTLPDEMREQQADGPSRAGAFVAMDPPEHTRYRRLLTGQFTVRRMKQLAPRVAEIVTSAIDTMIADGPSADLVTAFALPVPSLVICELLGVSYGDRAEFQARTAQMLRLDTPLEEMMRVREQLRGFMLGLVAQKRAEPTDDLLSGLIHGEADPALTDDELVNIATLLLVAGHETTANMLGLGTFALLEHPDQLETLRADPTLIDGAVEELLRYLSIVHLGISRVAVEDVELAGAHIPAGATVMVSLPETNRDPAQWDHPATLDVTRTRRPHLAFGHGVHQCLGQQLARVEMAVGFTELLRRLPDLHLAVPPDQVPLRTDMGVYGVHALPVSWTGTHR